MKADKVLIIEDEVKLARFIELELKHEGYEVCVSNDGRDGLDMFYNEKPDILLLDLMLPEISGIEVCRRVRKNSKVPIIMITAKGEIMDKVLGLDSGADDYVTKPFAIEELLARMRVALKRVRSFTEDTGVVLKLKNLVIDSAKREFELLFYLVKNKNIVITRDQILNNVWGYDYIGETNVVDVYIRYLRTKLDDKYNVKYIHTIRGVGYFAKDEE